MNHVVFVAGSYQPKRCGVAHYTAHLREKLLQKQVNSTVLTTHDSAQDIQDPNVIGAVQQWRLTELGSLVRAIRSSRADVLHIQHAAGTYDFDRSIFLLPLLLHSTGWRVPIITTVHEYGWWEWQPPAIPQQWLEWLKEWGQKRKLWDREDGFLLTRSHAVITTNDEAERIITQRLPHLKSRLHRIAIAPNITPHTTVPNDAERSESRQFVKAQFLAAQRLSALESQWPEDAVIAVFFGFLHPVKGIETLLLSFRQVLDLRPRARLLLVGGVESLALPQEQAAHYEQKLRQIVADLNLQAAVYMTGYVEAKTASQYLAGADFGVLPFNHGVTLKSGSLLALLHHALPVLATYSDPPNRELIDAQILKFVAPRDPNALTTEMLALIDNPDLRQQLSAKGYHYGQKFSWDHIVDTHLKIYQSLCT